MQNDKYKVKLMLNDCCIVDAECTCPHGKIVCHHIAALALYTHYNLSSTDQTCSWNIRKNIPCNEVRTISEMYGSFESPVTDVSDEDFANFKKTLGKLTILVGFSWLLRPEPELESNNCQTTKLNSIKSIINTDVCKQFVKAKQFDAVRIYIFDKCFITDDIILKNC